MRRRPLEVSGIDTLRIADASVMPDPVAMPVEPPQLGAALQVPQPQRIVRPFEAMNGMSSPLWPYFVTIWGGMVGSILGCRLIYLPIYPRGGR